MNRFGLLVLSMLLLPTAAYAEADDDDDDDAAAESGRDDDDKPKKQKTKAKPPTDADDEDEDDDNDSDSDSDSEDDDDDATSATKKRKGATKERPARSGGDEDEDEDEDEVEARTTVRRERVEAYHHVPPRVVLAGELLGAAPLDSGNRELFGAGGGVGIGADIFIAPLIGISAGVSVLALAAGGGMSSTNWVGGHVGPRVHLGPTLFGSATKHAAWFDAHVTYGSSGGIRRPGFDVGVGVQWELKPAVRIGPLVRYQFGSDPRDVNAQLLTVGLAIGFGGRGRNEVHVEGDADGDGVVDSSDLCPERAAGANPDRKREGCPVPDADGDGVLDGDDLCPDDEVGDKADPSRAGCPFLDQDGDGILDEKDMCPKESGPPNPFTPASHGCPVLARVVEGKIEILQQIFFETDSATIKDESFPVLQAVAATIKGLNGVRIRVEGHTDQQGTDEYNLDLSKRRARGVAQWLIQNGGLDAKQLETEGYGRSRPIVSGAAADSSQNRRVEFVILGGK